MTGAFQQDIIELRNFKQKNNLKKMVVHFYEPPFTIDFFRVALLLEKLIPNAELSYNIYNEYLLSGLYPLITEHSMYLIEFENNGDEVLKQIEHYKKRVTEISNKLESKKFIEKATADIIELERKKLLDFNRKWELSTIGYMYV